MKYFWHIDTLAKDWNICLPKLLFIGISKKYDPRLGTFADPMLRTHLMNEPLEPRSVTLNVRPKTWDSRCESDLRPRNPKFQTGFQDPGHLSCLWFDSQDSYQNPVKDSATWFQKDLSCDVKTEDLNSNSQEKFAKYLRIENWGTQEVRFC